MLDRADLNTCHIALGFVRSLREYHRQPPDPAEERAIENLEAELTGCSSATEDEAAGENWVTTKEAAEMRGCTQSYMRRIAPHLGGHKNGRDWLIPKEAV
jgi:hypothetical protein